MILILNRWRQFSRRYFWPHLWVGIVAAVFGIPSALSNTNTTEGVTKPLFSFYHLFEQQYDDRSLILYNTNRYPTVNLDYWHKHAVRSAIRQLNWMIRVDNLHQYSAILTEANHQVLLECLNQLLMHPSAIYQVKRQESYIFARDIIAYSPALWIACVQGIRAGPVS